MKRILTSLLVILVLTLSAHPILIMHFCEGELQSFNIQKLNSNAICCMPTEMGEMENETTPLTTPLTSPLTSPLTPSQSFIASDNSCCLTTNVEVVTDNFTLNSAQSIQLPTVSTYMPAWFAVNYLINIVALDATIETIYDFPIYGSSLKTLDFLSLICVYRL